MGSTPSPIYGFVYELFAWSVTVAVLGFITFPWGMLAYKIWQGNKPIDEELREELGWRSFYLGWALAAAAIVLLVLDYLTVSQLGFPSGPIHIIYLVGFVSLASWMMMFFFSMDDYLQAFILAVLYLYIPAALLYLVSLLLRNPLLDYVFTWLIKPKE